MPGISGPVRARSYLSEPRPGTEGWAVLPSVAASTRMKRVPGWSRTVSTFSQTGYRTRACYRYSKFDQACCFFASKCDRNAVSKFPATKSSFSRIRSWSGIVV